MGDKWKWIEGFEGYFAIDKHGNILSVPRVIQRNNKNVHVGGNIRVPRVNRCGYFEYGVSPSSINDIRRGVTYANVPGRKRHEGTRQKRFTADEIRHIRASKKGNTQIANEFGVNQSVISRIRSGETYKEVR